MADVKVAIITGASSGTSRRSLSVIRGHMEACLRAGIGQKSAIALSKAGWSLTLYARRLEELLITKQMCANPDKILVVQGDVTDEHGVKHMFRKTVEYFGTTASLELYLSVDTDTPVIPGRLDLLFNVSTTYSGEPLTA